MNRDAIQADIVAVDYMDDSRCADIACLCHRWPQWAMPGECGHCHCAHFDEPRYALPFGTAQAVHS